MGTVALFSDNVNDINGHEHTYDLWSGEAVSVECSASSFRWQHVRLISEPLRGLGSSIGPVGLVPSAG